MNKKIALSLVVFCFFALWMRAQNPSLPAPASANTWVATNIFDSGTVFNGMVLASNMNVRGVLSNMNNATFGGVIVPNRLDTTRMHLYDATGSTNLNWSALTIAGAWSNAAGSFTLGTLNATVGNFTTLIATTITNNTESITNLLLQGTANANGFGITNFLTVTTNLGFPAPTVIGLAFTNKFPVSGALAGGLGTIGWPATLPTDSAWNWCFSEAGTAMVVRTAIVVGSAYTNDFKVSAH